MYEPVLARGKGLLAAQDGRVAAMTYARMEVAAKEAGWRAGKGCEVMGGREGLGRLQGEKQHPGIHSRIRLPSRH